MAEATSTADDRAIDALIEVMKSASSAEEAEARAILLRRLALQGDVIGSRVPAPRNITEIGGYLNLLVEVGQLEMRAQALAGILGVAGPNPPLGWLPARPPLSLVPLPNDRPEGPAQPAIPVTFWARSDFVPALQAALQTLHDRGCALPLLAPLRPLPPLVPGATAPDDPLPYLGRTLDAVPAAALRDPATDPLALARPQGAADPFRLAARVLGPGSVAVPPANWDVLQCDSTSCTPVAVAAAQYVPVSPILATAGFYPASPLPEPTSLASVAWARFTNVTGLVAGVSTLGDELALLHSPADVAGSPFQGRLGWRWNGTTFAAP